MDGRLWALSGALVAVAVVAVVLALIVAAERRGRRRDGVEAADRHRALEDRVDELSRRLAGGSPAEDEGSADWVITWGDRGEHDVPPGRVSNQLVLSAAFGEPLVKALAFGHGVRRALSPESRNWIGFEMRREVRRTRKARRREMRQAWRQMRAREGVSTSVAEQPARPPSGVAEQPARPPSGVAEQPARPPQGDVA